MLTIGVTDGIASGKSTVGRLLAQRGARVVDADQVAHETYAPGTPGFEAVLTVFGPGVLGPEGAIDRLVLGRIVFNDPVRLKQLTDIVWPLTRARVEALKAAAASSGAPAFVIEAVALREAGWRDLVDEVWLVRARPATVRQRLESRGLGSAEAEARLAAQAAADPGPDAAGVVIENDGDLAGLEHRVDAAWQEALSRSRPEPSNPSLQREGEGECEQGDG